MTTFKKSFLTFLAIVCAYFTAPYLGGFYDSLFPTELNSGWIGGSGSLQFIRGISLSLIFFLTLVGRLMFTKYTSVLWLISLPLLWEVSFDLDHIYIPVALALIAYGLSLLVRKIFGMDNPTRTS